MKLFCKFPTRTPNFPHAIKFHIDYRIFRALSWVEIALYKQALLFSVSNRFSYLNKAIITIAQRHKRSAKPPVIKPILVFVIHPSLAAFLLSFCTGICSSLVIGGEMLYSVDFSSGEEIKDGSEVFHSVEES